MQNKSNNIIYKVNKINIINFYTKNKRFLIPFLVVVSYVLFYFLIDLSSQSLVAHDEGLYARRSRLVEESSNWFSAPFPSPHHKTIGSYWFIALSIRIFGNSELALRLPSILASFLCLITLYLISLKISNKKVALISIFSLSSMPLWIQYSRYASPDMIFVLCILLTILFYLLFLESSENLNKSFYIFFSGLFISISFFIRSYMTFVPFIGLIPFFVFHFNKEKKCYKNNFLIGLLLGSIPTCFNIYFSYQKFGIKGITSLFDFAKKQVVGQVDFNNFLLIPLKYFYLTFPIGVILIILLIFTKPINNVKYPHLIYFYPLISLLLLIFMSTTYPHYYLFLLPSLSILFSERLQSYSFRFIFSKSIIKFILGFLIIGFSILILSFILFFNRSFITNYLNNSTLIYFISFFVILSFIFSLRYLFYNKSNSFNLIKLLFNLIIPQYISISLLYNFGIIGNPNSIIKSFISDKDMSPILKANTIYLYNVDTKIQTLLSFYLPSSKVLKSYEYVNSNDYIITSVEQSLLTFNDRSTFRPIRKIDKHVLLLKTSKK